MWLNIYNAADNFLSATYQPLLQNYDDILNLNVEYIGGDGQTEGNITNRLSNPSQYDAFAINTGCARMTCSCRGLTGRHRLSPQPFSLLLMKIDGARSFHSSKK